MRNQFFILLSVLLGQGRRMADVRIQPMHSHSHKNVMIDYSSGASGLPWAVDAATMLENFHSLVRDGAVPRRRCRGGGLEAAAGRLPAGRVALRHGRRRQAVSLPVRQQSECE